MIQFKENAWADRRMEGQTEGWMEGWTGGQMEGRKDRQILFHRTLPATAGSPKRETLNSVNL